MFAAMSEARLCPDIICYSMAVSTLEHGRQVQQALILCEEMATMATTKEADEADHCFMRSKDPFWDGNP
jgi:hypothetical protein